MEQAAADVAAEAHRRPGAEVDGADREDDLDERDAEHHRADLPDVAVSPVSDALVDDVGVEGREVQRRDGLDRLEDDDEDQPLRYLTR